VDKFLAVLYSNQSLCHIKKERSEEALKSANFSLRHNPKFVRAFFRKAAALLALNRFDEARFTIEEGLLLDPGNSDLLKSKAHLHVIANKSAADREEGHQKH